MKLNSCKFNANKRKLFLTQYNQHVEKTFQRRSSRWLDVTDDWIALQHLLKFVAMQAETMM